MIKSKSQVLITGVYRTGSEFLAHALNSRPDISVSMYRVNLFRFINGRYGDLTNDNQIYRLVTDLAHRLKFRYNLNLEEDKIYQILLSQKKKGILSYGVVYDKVMSLLYLNENTRVWAEKNQLLWREIPNFLEYFPKGKCIHIMRDPRAVLMSFKHYTSAPEPAYLAAALNCLDSMLHAKAQTTADTGRVLVIRFEDLVTNTKKVIENAWDFIGLSSRFKYQGINSAIDPYDRNWSSNSSFQKVSNVNNFNIDLALNGWRKKISTDELHFVECVCHKQMREWGYQTELNNFDISKARNQVLSSKELTYDFENFLKEKQEFRNFLVIR